MDDRLPRLVGHCVWANREWLHFIAKNAHGDEWLWRRLSHIMLGERAWFQRIHGEEPGRDIWTLLSIAQLEEISARHERVYQTLLRDDLARIVAYQRFTGERHQSPVSDILLHLTLHGAHHRGQMASHASARGLAPINTDFIEYCRVHQL
jgi:uncharacterized damage-inducible protein DinB